MRGRSRRGNGSRKTRSHLYEGTALAMLRPRAPALTAAPILSDEIVRDDTGRVTEAGRVYWFPDYQVRDEIDEIRQKLVLLFQGVA